MNKPIKNNAQKNTRYFLVEKIKLRITHHHLRH